MKTTADILRTEGMDLHQHGNTLRGLCPLHDRNGRNPSFTVWENGRWRCWSCGESGDRISLVMKLHGMTYSNGFPVGPICEKETCYWRLEKFAVPTELTFNLAELLMVYFIMRHIPMHSGDQGFRGIYYGAYNKIEALLEKIHGIGYAQHCISHGQSFVEPNGPYKDIISIIATNTYVCEELDYYNSNNLNTAAKLSHLDDDSTYHKGENENVSENDVSESEFPF
jgi:hypothetical protein